MRCSTFERRGGRCRCLVFDISSKHHCGRVDHSTRLSCAGREVESGREVVAPMAVSVTTTSSDPDRLGGEPVPLDLEYDRAGALLVADLGPPLEVQGSVVDKTSERAVSGAFVWLQADPGIWTRSDNHGFFRLPIPPGNHPVLSVDASGYLPTTAPVAHAKPESAYTLPLERAGSAHVLVTSSRGEPIAAFTAAIRCEAMPAAHDSRAQGIRRYFGDGNGRLDLQAPNERPSIITLESRARLSGRVYASDGRVLEGAAVELLPTDASSRRRHRALYVWDSETATDDEGRFQLGGLLPGRFNLRARAADHQPWIQEVQLVEGDTSEVVITLESGALVQGIVETNRGAPVAGATVSSGGSQTESDGSGQFSLNGIAPGETRVVARHPDHGRTADRVVVEASGSYIQLTFPPGGSLAGAVLDPDGREISAAEVAVMNDLVSPTLRRTDANGRFEFSHLPTTDQLRIIAKKAGFVDAQQISRIVSGEKTEVCLTLVPACSVTGSIRSSLPENVDAVRVFAAKAAGLTRSGEVGLGGEYRIDGLSDGVWNVTAQGPSGARGEARIECRPDSSLHRVDLDLNDGYALAIRVRSDTPASPARVKIENKDGFVVDSGHTDHFGVFRATGLRAGAYRVRVLSDYGNLTAASVVQIPRNHPLEIYLSSPRK